jgi:Wings apart-like protein regulation of heterochromatin
MHELQQAGKSKQFADEVHYLLEGLRSSALNVRRSTTSEIAIKILDEKFVAGIRPHSSIREILSHLKDEKDPVFISNA